MPFATLAAGDCFTADLTKVLPERAHDVISCQFAVHYRCVSFLSEPVSISSGWVHGDWWSIFSGKLFFCFFGGEALDGGCRGVTKREKRTETDRGEEKRNVDDFCFSPFSSRSPFVPTFISYSFEYLVFKYCVVLHTR